MNVTCRPETTLHGLCNWLNRYSIFHSSQRLKRASDNKVEDLNERCLYASYASYAFSPLKPLEPSLHHQLMEIQFHASYTNRIFHSPW